MMVWLPLCLMAGARGYRSAAHSAGEHSAQTDFGSVRGSVTGAAGVAC